MVLDADGRLLLNLNPLLAAIPTRSKIKQLLISNLAGQRFVLDKDGKCPPLKKAIETLFNSEKMQ